MMLRLQELTRLLEISDPKAIEIRRQLQSAFSNAAAVRAVIEEQCEEKVETNCYTCDAEGTCFALRGIAYISIGQIKEALRELENSEVHFRSEDNVWNSVIGTVLIGMAHGQNENNHEALLHYQKALNLLQEFLHDHENDYGDIERARALIKELMEHDESLLHARTKKMPRQNGDNARISFPWMPAYTGLHAGPGGPLWSDQLSQDSHAFMETVILEDRPHVIYSLVKGDHVISLNPEKKYGWAKVSGDSMNASQPVPILQDDFVLFHESNDAENGAIVIASCPDEAGSGCQFIIKRYVRNGRLLISETNPPDLYLPISIRREIKIIGRALAVAKFEGP
jgi:tetratricopeptide (TPR) repeat protein